MGICAGVSYDPWGGTHIRNCCGVQTAAYKMRRAHRGGHVLPLDKPRKGAPLADEVTAAVRAQDGIMVHMLPPTPFGYGETALPLVAC